MIKTFILQSKKRAIDDDNKYWARQEEYIKRGDIKLSDIKFSHKFFIFSLSFLCLSLIHLYFNL